MQPCKNSVENKQIHIKQMFKQNSTCKQLGKIFHIHFQNNFFKFQINPLTQRAAINNNDLPQNDVNNIKNELLDTC